MIEVPESLAEKTLETEKRIASYAEQNNALLSEHSLNLLKERENWRQIVDELLEEGHFVLKPELIEKKLIKTKINLAEEEVVVKHTRFKPAALEIEASYRILKEHDVTNQSSSEGTAKDFLNFFQNKFELISKMLKKRHILHPQPLNALKRVSANNDVDLVGMVSRKWISKKGHLTLELEDLEEKCIAVISQNSPELMEEGNRIMLDDVIGIKGKKLANDLILVQQVLWPDLPIDRKRKKVEKDVSLASISDIHIGSKLFLEKNFQRFLSWINGRTGSESDKKEAGKIKYLVITGDNVDGIGVYPNQFDELVIKDIAEQYSVLSEFLLQIPEYIEVFIIPGNHDAVRVADPQPAVPKKLVPELYEAKNIHLMGSPSWVEIEGLKALLYHGASMHDLFASVPDLNPTIPQKGVKELLKRRDLMCAYGMSHPYVPEKRDFMVIKEEPDLVFTGEMHHNGYANYRGTTIICNGTWQSQTGYQAKLGHKPTPGIVPVLNLSTGSIKENIFH